MNEITIIVDEIQFIMYEIWSNVDELWFIVDGTRKTNMGYEGIEAH